MSENTFLGLSAGDVLPIVERAIGAPLASLSFTFQHRIDGHPGYQGKKVIPTFQYRTKGSQPGRFVMFVKRHDKSERIKSSQFRHLAEGAAPIPELYGTLRDSKGREILFLEYLPKITTAPL